jgi:hypothetical protein
MKNIEKSNSQRFLLIFVLGLINSLKNNLISLNEAEQLLFSPATAELLTKNSCDQKIIDLIHLGTELEDILSILPNNFSRTLDEIEKQAIFLLREMPAYNYDEEKIILKLFNAKKVGRVGLSSARSSAE